MKLFLDEIHYHSLLNHILYCSRLIYFFSFLILCWHIGTRLKLNFWSSYANLTIALVLLRLWPEKSELVQHHLWHFHLPGLFGNASIARRAPVVRQIHSAGLEVVMVSAKMHAVGRQCECGTYLILSNAT